MRRIVNLWKALVELFFPSHCVACKEKLLECEEHLCSFCLMDLPRATDAKILSLFEDTPSVMQAVTFLHFSKGGFMQSIVHSLKYNNNPPLGTFLGGLAYQEMNLGPFFEDIDFIVPIPLHRKRERVRGYNQSLFIAKGLSRYAQKPIITSCIERKVNNLSQTSLSKKQRKDNVAGIFAVTDACLLRDKHILLVDDVLTTGATIKSCIDSIDKEKLDVKVSVFTLGTA